MKKTTMLLIMDGFGIAPAGSANAISCANTPNLDKLFNEYPNSQLQASGRFVGLPDGQMGNSEVGHTNIGAGRVVWQELSKITNEIEDGSFFKNEEFLAAMDNAKKNGSAVHLMGLLSDGGVHSHIDHILALVKMAKECGVQKLYLHGILDGRDVPPACAEKYIGQAESCMQKEGLGKLASLSGRYYAMDRDKRWERVSLAYNCYTRGEGRRAKTAMDLIRLARENNENDEFVMPGMIDEDCTIKDNDSVIFCNFRPDRAREITRCFTDPQFDGFERDVVLKNLCYVCFTTYDATIPNVRIAFKPQSLKNTLGEYISSLGRTQLRIAETEKYAHVTFFFNGGIEEPYEGERRILVASPKVATYDLKPEMSAYEVTDKLLEELKKGDLDLIIMNLANCDMVGHTGVFEAAVKAVETVDECVGKVVSAIKSAHGDLLITADHGNADEMLDADGKVVTAHSTNPVPLILVSDKEYKLNDGALCDLAPTLLSLMGIDIPAEMEGKNLLC